MVEGMQVSSIVSEIMDPLIRAERYSHGVRLFGYNRETFIKLTSFLEGLSLKEPKKMPHGGMIMELKKKYYGLTADYRELYIHRHHFEELLNYLVGRGVDPSRISQTLREAPAYVPAEYVVKEFYKLFDYQEIIVDELVDELYSRRLDLQTGKGKAAPLDAKIRIPGGWSTMGEMELGTKIIAPDGTETEVTGIFPQGITPVMRVTFGDGRSTECCPEHLWKVFYVNASPDKRWRVVNTMEMFRLINMPNPRVYVQLIEPEVQPAKDFPIPPYTLGVILGDGHIGEKVVQISKEDQDLFGFIEEELIPGHRLNVRTAKDRCHTRGISRTDTSTGTNAYVTALTSMGLAGVTSSGKFIPEEYFEGSRDQRLALLQGLMDTDGTANSLKTGGAISFCSTSYRLATGVQYLVRSLGGIASISVRHTQYTHNGVKKNGQVSYDVNIRYKKPSELFRIARKKERTNDEGQYCANLKLRVKSIEFVGQKETQCISVAHEERLYVTDDFIVTHNTLSALSAVARLKCRTIAMVYPKYFGIWEKALKETYEDIDGRYVTVSGSDELKTLIQRGLNNDLPWDFYIVSNVSYRSYIEAFEKFGEDAMEDLGFMVPPHRFHETIGFGCQINDEYQDDPALAFRIDMYTNVKKQIFLSATPFTGNPYVSRMIDVQLPRFTHCTLPAYDAYAEVISLFYGDVTVKPRDYLTPYKNTYNHARYETQMLKHKTRLATYFAMVKRIVQRLYASDHKPKQKMLILCSTVVFIQKLTQYLQKEFPQLQIGGHYSGSDPKLLQENNITVSTIKSAGTGQDIINLREVLLLQATGSERDTEQIKGRLRKLKDYPEVTPQLTYLVCTNIPQHIRYDNLHKADFEGKCKSHKTMRIG